MFSEEEKAYLKSQRLARIATVSPALQPDVAPVGFGFNGEQITIGGYDISRTLKYKNVKAGNLKVAIVIDDLASVSPWTPRGIKVHGSAEIIEGRDGKFVLLITPERHWSWGIHKDSFDADGKPVSRKVWHNQE